MLEIYFAITNDMMEKYGMPENIDNTLSWTIQGNTWVDCALSTSPGKLIDLLEQMKSKYDYICKAVIDNEVAVDLCRSALVGDTYSSLKVKVVELTYVKREK